jgi:hypothetical protein
MNSVRLGSIEWQFAKQNVQQIDTFNCNVSPRLSKIFDSQLLTWTRDFLEPALNQVY